MTISAWDALTSEPTQDQAWADAAALLVLTAATTPTPSRDLAQLRAQLGDTSLTHPADDIRAQLRLLVVQLDAVLRHRQAEEQLAMGETGRRAQVLDAIRNAGGTAFNEKLEADTGLRPPHLSRACNELLDAGLLLRRTYGKRAEWTLTPLADSVRTHQAEPTPAGETEKALRARIHDLETEQEGLKKTIRVLPIPNEAATKRPTTKASPEHTKHADVAFPVKHGKVTLHFEDGSIKRIGITAAKAAARAAEAALDEFARTKTRTRPSRYLSKR